MYISLRIRRETKFSAYFKFRVKHSKEGCWIGKYRKTWQKRSARAWFALSKFRRVICHLHRARYRNHRANIFIRNWRVNLVYFHRHRSKFGSNRSKYSYKLRIHSETEFKHLYLWLPVKVNFHQNLSSKISSPREFRERRSAVSAALPESCFYQFDVV